MPSVGLIVEGEFDAHAYSHFIRRENAVGVDVQARICGGPVVGKFVRILTDLRYLSRALDRAVVVADAHGKDRDEFRFELQGEIRDVRFPFPVEIVIVVEELEAILLCDPRAIENICAERGTPIALPNIVRNPEHLPDPKTELTTKLSLGRVIYTRSVAAAIAERANLGSLDYWSRSYRDLRAAIRF